MTKVMVVDDEPDTVDLVKLVLETEGFIHVFYCTRGTETDQSGSR